MKKTNQSGRKMKKSVLALVLTLSILAVTAIGVSVTLAFMKKTADPVENTFVPGDIPGIEIVENLKDNIKKEVTVKNTGNAPAYLRIQLLSYRVNEEGEHIGGIAAVPAFTPGTGWLDQGEGIYVYSKPVEPGDSAPYLIGSTGIKLATYDDLDGGKQVVEVIGESVLVEDVADAWNVSVASDGTLSLK